MMRFRMLKFAPSLLINPNQCCAFGTSVCNDPVDLYQPLGILTHDESMFVPINVQGTIVYFESHVLFNEELAACPHFVLCNDTLGSFEAPF